MHIPDGFLDTKTIIATSLFSLVGIGRALKVLKTQMSPRKVPLMGLAAAFIFVAQMINFPVIAGTSGHLLGAVLVAVLLGPSEGILVMSVVLIVQCFLFADGGVLALGANIFNMGIIAPMAGYSLYRLVSGRIKADYGKYAAVAFAAWSSTVLASVCCVGELAWSGTARWSIGFPAVTGIHMLIGIGEALITTFVLASIYKARPDLRPFKDISGDKRETRPLTGVLIYGSLMLLGFVLFVLPFASRWPDGLEKVAATLGFDTKALARPMVPSPIPEYRVPGIGSLPLATALAGVIGAILVFVVSLVLAKILFRKSRDEPSRRKWTPGQSPEPRPPSKDHFS
jgi:cobalt/nickel transport system permease protein